MGKRIDQLKLDDTPLGDGAADVRETAWYQFVQEIDDLLATGRYTWAEDTLTGIQETVEKLQRVSDAQRTAVANIEAASGRTGRRRYEGFRRR